MKITEYSYSIGKRGHGYGITTHIGFHSGHVATP